MKTDHVQIGIVVPDDPPRERPRLVDLVLAQPQERVIGADRPTPADAVFDSRRTPDLLIDREIGSPVLIVDRGRT